MRLLPSTFRLILTILAPYLAGILALYSFTSWITASIFTAGITIFTMMIVRTHERHQHPQYDDRLTSERMRIALQRHLKAAKRSED